MSPWTLLSVQTRRPSETCEDRRTSSMERLSTGPVSRSARANPRVRNALSRHSTLGCRCAPRPGSRPSVSRTRTDPRSSRWATMRTRSDATPCFRHPTQVRTGCFRTAEGGVGSTGAAGSDAELEPEPKTARLTSPKCNRNSRGSAAPRTPASGIHFPPCREPLRVPLLQADASVSLSFRPTPPCRAGCRCASL
jgi:hypothetical protein